jgi:hypothetical protein
VMTFLYFIMATKPLNIASFNMRGFKSGLSMLHELCNEHSIIGCKTIGFGKMNSVNLELLIKFLITVLCQV